MVHILPVEGLQTLETMLAEEAAGGVMVPAMIGGGTEDAADEKRTRLVSFLACSAPSILPEGASRREASAMPYLAFWPQLSDSVFLSMVSVIQRRDDILNVDLATLTAMLKEYMSELGAMTKFDELYAVIASTAFRWNNEPQTFVIELPPMATNGLSAACLFTRIQSSGQKDILGGYASICTVSTGSKTFSGG